MAIGTGGSGGSGSMASIGAGSVANLIPAQQSKHCRLHLFLSADQTIQALLKISDDTGTTYYTARQDASSVVTADAGTGTFVNAIAVDYYVPAGVVWKLDVKNTGAGAAVPRACYYLYDDNSLNG